MPVLTISDINLTSLRDVLARYALTLCVTTDGAAIPGSFWGDSEAGLIGASIHVRRDTPLHSVLHEAGHYVCMDSARRATLDTNAGGGTDEENGVCYLQILLACWVAGVDSARMYADMDEWGYSFRLGSARAWFERDAQDAHAWLLAHHLINHDHTPTWKLRE